MIPELRPSHTGPLLGYRVLELARLAPGQLAGMLLADLGADVLRIEEPQATDGATDRAHPAYAPNRGKRSIVLDLKSGGGLEVFRRLAERADVVLECFRPGVMDRLGIGYNALAELNPGLVYCSLSGYGQTGPLREMPGHDLNYISLAGLASLTSATDSWAPVVPGVLMADFAGGSLHAALAIVSALLAKETAGMGQYLDIAMTDGAMLLAAAQIATGQIAQQAGRTRQEWLRGRAPYYNFYETADGKWLSVGALEPYFWANLCQALGLEGLIDLQHAEGVERERVFESLRATFRLRSRDEWVEFFQDKNTCVAPVLTFDELPKHPQIAARKMLRPVPESGVRGLRQIGISMNLSATPAQAGGPPPAPGEHSRQVLMELDLAPDEIDALMQSGAVQ